MSVASLVREGQGGEWKGPHGLWRVVNCGGKGFAMCEEDSGVQCSQELGLPVGFADEGDFISHSSVRKHKSFKIFQQRKFSLEAWLRKMRNQFRRRCI